MGARTLARWSERALLRLNFVSDRPQLFILGLPRTGSTLVYQYIVHRLRVAYFTNGVGRYSASPCVVTFLQRTFNPEYRSSFRSHYGKVSGPVSPREAGGFWIRYFGIDDYVRFDEMSERDIRFLRNTIACTQRIYGDAPFVNKNVKHLLRIDALGKIFPNSFLLFIERDIEQVALSVLRARYANLDDPAQWWSVKPPDYDELKGLPATQQVARQLASLQQRMEADLAEVPPERVLQVRYETFCARPEDLIERLRGTWGNIPHRNEAVSHFEVSANTPETDEERQLIDAVKACI